MAVFELQQIYFEIFCFSQKSPQFWKFSESSWKVFCYIYQILVVLVTVYIIFCEFLFIYRNFYEIYEVTACVAPLIAHILNLTKLYTLCYQNSRIHAVIDEIKQMFNDEKDPKFIKLLQKCNRYDQFVSPIIFVVYCMLGTVYSLKPIIRNFLYVYVYEIEPIYDMPTISSYFFDETVSPAYEISYFICVFCLISSCGIHIASDTAFICCFLNICCQFDILSEMINQNDLKRFVNHHRKIIKLTNEVNDLFKATIFGTYLMLGTMVCVNGFQLVMAHDLGKCVIAVCFGLSAIFSLFVYSYGGQTIMDSSMNVCDQMHKINRDYWLIIMRVQQPIKIEAPFFHACLPTFMAILNSAGSMITLLKSFV